MTGESIAHYRITAKLGEGGMGAVYRASDTKLNRDVAIKILPAAFVDDRDRMARFEREAQVLASLNHPNIAAIYGLEERALVLELVEGPTLDERLAAGHLPVEEALRIAVQIAEALEYAHEKGVVHRDLKPANVKITPEGLVKVLDFGLAKIAGEPAAASADAANSPTLTMRATQAGIILGTASYMSPEQAAARPVDRRADIWSFGVVLWEMLTGRRLFAGETVSHTLADVLRAEIDVSKVPEGAMRDLVRRCLDRDVKTRLRDIGEARIAIQRYLADPRPASPVQAPAAAQRSRAPWMVAGVCAAAAAALGGILAWRALTPPPAPPTARFLLHPPPGHFLSHVGFAVSPDGRHIAVRALDARGRYGILVRSLDGEFRPLGTPSGAYGPFWSPDGKSLGYFAESSLFIAGLDGAPARAIAPVEGTVRGADWNREGVILFNLGEKIARIPEGGGRIVVLDHLKARVAFPRFLPDGRRFLYTVRGASLSGSGIWVASLEGDAPNRRVVEADSEAAYTVGDDLRTGHLFFRRGEALMAAAFDAERAEITGEPFLVVQSAARSRSGRLPVSAARPGHWLAMGGAGAEAPQGTAAIFDRAGRSSGEFAKPAANPWEHIELSPDERRLLGQLQDDAGARFVWVLDMARGVSSRLAGEPDSGPAAWSADGRRVYYAAKIGATRGIWSIPADGSGKPELLASSNPHHMHASEDGRWLAYEFSLGAEREIHVLPLQGERKPAVTVSGKGRPGHPQFSPDGKWLAYTSSETGPMELYVQSHPPGNGRWQVTNMGVLQARWRRDGREICFASTADSFHCLSVTPKNGGLEFGVPVKLFDARLAENVAASYFDMSADGKKFYLNLAPADADATPLTLFLNWSAGLKR